MNESNKKFRLFLIISCLLIVGGFFLALVLKPKELIVSNINDEGLIKNIEVNLTNEEKQQLDSRVNSLLAEIENGSKVEGYNYSLEYLKLGGLYETIGELEKARQSYISAANLNPFISVPWNNLCSLYQRMGNNGLALEAIEKAIKIEPKLFNNWAKYIELYQFSFNAGESKMREIYEQSFLVTDHNLDLHISFARYLESIDRKQEAINEWRFVISRNQNDELAKKELARLMGKNK